MLGCLVAVYLNNILGRRLALIVTALISITGVLIEMTSAIGPKPQYDQFVAGKTIASLSMGLAANIVPLYLSETSTAAARGFGINMYQNVQIIGYIVASASVYATTTATASSSLAFGGNDKLGYLIPMGLQLLAPTLMLICTPFLPESPRWLVWKGRPEDEAIAAAHRLFGTNTNTFDAREYVATIQVMVDMDREREASAPGWADLLLHRPTLRRTAIAAGIQCLQQAQGSGYMVAYIFSFLTAAGVRDVFPIMMGLNIVYYLAVLSGHVLPDRFGRRPILLLTAAACGVGPVLIAILAIAVVPSTAASEDMAVLAIFLWYVFFGIQSPLVWITTAEAAPSRNREKVQAVAVFLGFGVSLLVAFVSPFIQDPGYGNLGAKIGFIWGTFSWATALWVFFTVPEMRGLSLEQLDYLYENRVATRKFKDYDFTGFDLRNPPPLFDPEYGHQGGHGQGGGGGGGHHHDNREHVQLTDRSQGGCSDDDVGDQDADLDSRHSSDKNQASVRMHSL
ncbi:general substrate transporter [Microdochium trichocladiopsis]|uniref:General substrate transporter n=1 Tax=Microdochium trichocladiopsis TaxID=1682393 RepID=A0A9P9BS81_9PEZI|nr:general substrate transporter [Microdochium trichocladiopsis]KAH7033478.1 general substrate transporter [Microdochium trichocladiopsis]